MIATTATPQLSNEEYHSLSDYHSSSSVKLFLDSRREYHSRYVLGEPQPSKSAFDLGRVAHALILEPHLLDGVVKEIPREVLASNGAKSGNNWKAYAEANKDCILLKSDEMLTVKSMFDAVYQNPLAAKLLRAPGPTEQSILSDSDRKYRVRPDKLSGQFIVDLKTTADASPRGFWRSVLNFRYYLQAAIYKLVSDAHYGHDHTFVFIAVNTTKPHQVATYTIGPEYIQRGEQELFSAIAEIEECHASGDWREPWEKELLQINTPKYWREADEFANN